MGKRHRRAVRLLEAVTTAATKTEDGASFPAQAFAYVPDSAKPSTWRLRLWESPDAKETAQQVGMALAAISPGGFRGRKVAVPAEALPVVKRRIMAAWRKVHPDEPASDVPAVLQEAISTGGMTFAEVSDLVEDAVEERLGIDDSSPGGGVWIADISDAWAVYSVGCGDDYWQVDYTIDDAGNVTLGDTAQVDRQTMYVTATESVVTEPGRLIEAKGTDAAGGRVFGVQIIESGDSKNGRRYPSAVLNAASRLYEGAKAYDHHRTEQELQTSTIAGLVGSYRNVKPNSRGLEGDLHLLPSAVHTAEALDASLETQNAGLAPLVGISHDVMARYRPLNEGGRRLMEATEICSVNSADVVADPAAGGRATRMVAGGIGDPNTSKEDDAMTLKELLALLRGASPESRAELLKEHASVLDDAGLSADDIHIPEPAAEPEKELVTAGAPATESRTLAAGGERSTEATYGRSSAMGRVIVRSAVEDAKLDPRLTESIAKQLPDHFTEADLDGLIEQAKHFAEGFELAGLTPSVPDVKVVKDVLDKKVEQLDEMFNPRTPGGYRSLKEAYVDITGKREEFLSGDDFARQILRESVGANPYDSGVSRGTESVDSSTWNTILGDSITRRAVAEYNQPGLNNWRQIVSNIFNLTDFRTQRIERMGGYGVLPTVNQGAPYQPLTSPGNEEATYAAAKKGGTEDLTYETILNDDLRAVQRIPTKLGLAAAQTLYRFVWDMIATNATCTYDSTTLFHANHSNTDNPAVLSASTLGNGRKKMRKQAAYGDTSDILSIIPRFVIVPSDLEVTAYQLVSANEDISATIAGVPNIHQGLTPIVVDYWTDTNDWFLVADPGMVPTIEVGFLNGRDNPELFVQNDPTVGSVFTSDKITYKIRHVYGGTVLDHRAFYRGAN